MDWIYRNLSAFMSSEAFRNAEKELARQRLIDVIEGRADVESGYDDAYS